MQSICWPWVVQADNLLEAREAKNLSQLPKYIWWPSSWTRAMLNRLLLRKQRVTLTGSAGALGSMTVMVSSVVM